MKTVRLNLTASIDYGSINHTAVLPATDRADVAHALVAFSEAVMESLPEPGEDAKLIATDLDPE